MNHCLRAAWTASYDLSIYKKRIDCGNYRGIANYAYKGFSRILFSKMFFVGDNQCAVSNTDQTFTLRQIPDKLREYNITTVRHVLLRFAYDIHIISTTRSTVEEAFVSFEREATRIGLTIQLNRSKW